MATPLAAGRGGFTRARDHPPRLRPMHGPVLAQPGEPEMGNPLSVPEDDSIGYGAGDDETWRIASVAIRPYFVLDAVLDDGTPIKLTAEVADFVPFARQVLAIHAAT